MISIHHEKTFTTFAVDMFMKAELIVRDIIRNDLRCHEVARIVHAMLKDDRVKLHDGNYGAIEHSWLMVDGFILDVYAIGSLPQVQLIDPRITGIPTLRYLWRSYVCERDDIDEALVKEMVEAIGG